MNLSFINQYKLIFNLRYIALINKLIIKLINLFI